MSFDYNGERYRTIFGSDVRDGHDGVYLELYTPKGQGVLGASWSDMDGSFTFFAEQVQLPFAVVETFMQEARRLLPADRRVDPESPE